MAEKKVASLLSEAGAGSSGPSTAEPASACALLGLARGSWYYRPVRAQAEDVAADALLDERAPPRRSMGFGG